MSVARRARHSTIHVTDVDGVTWQGDGEGLAQAARDLGQRHRQEQPQSELESTYALTGLALLSLTATDLEAAHTLLHGTAEAGEGCAGCRICRTTLPLLRRALTAASRATAVSDAKET
jgi:hypothetical protein